VKQIIERASQDGKDFEHECRLVMPDNAIKHIYVVAYAVTNESNKLEFVGAVMDVTARRQAEGALRYQNGTEPVSRQRHIRIDPKN
jgi:PAS domain-containing protein